MHALEFKQAAQGQNDTTGDFSYIKLFRFKGFDYPIVIREQKYLAWLMCSRPSPTYDKKPRPSHNVHNPQSNSYSTF